MVDFFETALRRGNEALNIEAIAVSGESPAVGRTLEALALRQATERRCPPHARTQSWEPPGTWR